MGIKTGIKEMEAQEEKKRLVEGVQVVEWKVDGGEVKEGWREVGRGLKLRETWHTFSEA